MIFSNYLSSTILWHYYTNYTHFFFQLWLNDVYFKPRLLEYFNLRILLLFKLDVPTNFSFLDIIIFTDVPVNDFGNCYCCLFLAAFYIISQYEQNLGVWKFAYSYDQQQGYHSCLHLPVFPSPILPSRASLAYPAPTCLGLLSSPCLALLTYIYIMNINIWINLYNYYINYSFKVNLNPLCRLKVDYKG